MNNNHSLGDGPVQLEYVEQMTLLARQIDVTFNADQRHPHKKVGFVLLVFPFGEGGPGEARCNFISNGADRKAIVSLFKEMIARFEGQPEMSGRG